MHILFYNFTLTPGQDKGGSEKVPHTQFNVCPNNEKKNSKKKILIKMQGGHQAENTYLIQT